MNTAICRTIPAAALLALLAGCKSVEVPKVPGITPYRMVIQQGNFISQEMVSQLKPGMTREQVRFILGTPLVADIFHADRWDYVFFRETPDGKKEQRNLSVVFEKDKLARVLGDLLPSDGATPASTGFQPLLKPEAKPAAVAKPAAKPAAEAPKPAAEAPAAAEAAKPVSTSQNWGTASDQPAKQPEPAPAPVAKEEEAKPAEEPKERGFFGRMLEKIGL
jgi:outer membrane protein assembly factor BamE